MAYPTTAELVAQSTVAELTSLTAEQQDGLRTLAIDAIERYTGQDFGSTVDTLRVDGSGGDELYPPRRVEELTSITVKGTAVDVTDVLVDADGYRLFMGPLSTDYAVQAMRDEAFDTRTFRSGPGTILLEGTFGWTDPPDQVAQAIRLDMEEQALADASGLAGITRSARRLGLRNLSQGNLRADIGSPEVVSDRVARLLSRYVNRGRAGYLI